MADEFKFDSELGMQSPADAQIPIMQRGMLGSGGGRGGLADLLNQLTEGLLLSGAYYQAGEGNVAPLQMLQEQQQRKNLMSQLQSMSQQEMEGPFGQTLQRQLQFGDLAGAQKTLVNLPRYKEAQDVLKNPKLGLSPDELESLNVFASVDPEGAIKLGQRLVAESKVTKRQMEVGKAAEARAIAKEERALARAEAKTPSAVIAEAIRKKILTAENAKEVLPGILRGKGIAVPTDPNERQLFFQDLLADPTLQLLPAKKQQGIFGSIRSFLFGEPQVAPEQAAPMQTEEQKRQRLQELLRKQQGQ